MYGDRICVIAPTVLANPVPVDRSWVGNISVACKITTNEVIPTANLFQKPIIQLGIIQGIQ